MSLKQRNKTPPPHLALKSLLFMTERERDEQLMKSFSSSSSSGSGYSSSLKVLLLIVVSILVPISLVAYLVGINQNLLFWFPSSSSSTLLLLSNGKFTYNHHQLLIPGEVEVNKTVLLDEYQPLMKAEASLAYARALIKEAFYRQNNNSSTTLLPPHKQQEQEEDLDYVPNGEIYRNPHVFHRSYLLMEKIFKIFVYEEGEPPLFHTGPCKGIYSMEGMFISLLEMEDRFRTSDPDQAHVYFLPFSVAMIIKYLFHPIIRDKAVLQRTVVDYVRIISEKYPYWNRSFGADHFMLSCHDWGPRATWYVPQLYYNSIRVLCNANTSERFNPKKDASFPEINLKTGELTGLIGGLPPSSRPILAFFAGRMHGRIRGPLFQHWKEKDEDLRIYEQLPEGINYNEMMNKSKYCICPSGHEVASPRIVEAIYAECVPVLISQHYVLPFNDVLDWNSFSVQVSVNEIPNLKKILMEIPQDQYEKLQGNVKRVQRHFVVNDPPKRYDVFHMIIHLIWLRRLNFHII